MPIQKHIANIVTTLGIITGIVACVGAVYHPSFMLAETYLALALILDALDGWCARRFGGHWFGPYLDDIADALNFGIHPAVWIYLLTDSLVLAVIFALSIVFRLVRFTLQKENKSVFFSGLPSPASAIALLGLLFFTDSILVAALGVMLISVLSCSTLPCLHVIKGKIIAPHILLIGTVLFFTILWMISGGQFFLIQFWSIMAYVLLSGLLFYNPRLGLRDS
ncbi:CDP-alcohol phosphatidyltransferase family protein [Candidatus Gracilibacteria bacterium]|nr:CDP-alcohol phosphatidyltransferase family protein [Candidatus Gracilibacteria bacterium]